jgi:hypothetical protein
MKRTATNDIRKERRLFFASFNQRRVMFNYC